MSNDRNRQHITALLPQLMINATFDSSVVSRGISPKPFQVQFPVVDTERLSSIKIHDKRTVQKLLFNIRPKYNNNAIRNKLNEDSSQYLTIAGDTPHTRTYSIPAKQGIVIGGSAPSKDTSELQLHVLIIDTSFLIFYILTPLK